MTRHDQNNSLGLTKFSHDQLSAQSGSFDQSSHVYVSKNGKPFGGFANGVGFSINWQAGAFPQNGAVMEDVLMAVHQRLQHYEENGLGHVLNRAAMEHIELAIKAMMDRKSERQHTGLLGVPVQWGDRELKALEQLQLTPEQRTQFIDLIVKCKLVPGSSLLLDFGLFHSSSLGLGLGSIRFRRVVREQPGIDYPMFYFVVTGEEADEKEVTFFGLMELIERFAVSK